MAAKILVVEDNPMNMELVTDLLKAKSFEVLQATAVPEAREILRETKPDLILLDIQLPEFDGLALAKELQADPRYKDIPLVALTAYAMAGDEAKVREAGCCAYITKPIELETFLASVERHLTRCRAAGDEEDRKAAA